MRLRSFQIKNFRSIKDSGICYLSSDITILAGKNESGKTNLLEALNKFNKSEKFTDSDYPIDGEADNPIEITSVFTLSKKEIIELLKELEIKIALNDEEYSLDITKVSNQPDYLYSGPLKDHLDGELHKLNNKIILDANRIISVLLGFVGNSKELEDQFSLSEEDSHEEIVKKINDLIDLLNKNQSVVEKQEEKDKLDELRNELVDIKSKTDIAQLLDKIKAKISLLIPKIVLFSSFGDILPDEVEIDQAHTKKIVTDFCKISGLNIEEIKDASKSHKRKKLVDRASTVVNGDFDPFWRQDNIKVKSDIDGSKLQFFVYDVERDIPFKLAQRSKGLQWFLSFYITLQAEGKNQNNIILIDEPGLYLHATAQENVLSVLSDLSKKNQILFTTHMPYLIDPSRLDRVRLVLKNKSTGESIVENKIHKTADKDTLTPIITAIGLDLSKGLSIARNNNIILEGISDYYYLQAVLKYLKEKTDFNFPKDISFIPSVGADKIPHLVSLFIGWDLKYAIILDHDDKGKKVFNFLTRCLQVDEKQINFISNQDGCCIEDLFSKTDLKKYILAENSTADKGLSNSELIKKSNSDKVLLAKLFFEKINTEPEKINLSATTVGNFKNIFDKLK